MDMQQVEPMWGKIKDFILKNKLALMGVVAALIAIVVGYRFYQSQPKSVLSAIHIEFKGYDGYGQIDYDATEIDKEIQKIAYQSVGFTKSQIQDLLNEDDLFFSEIAEEPTLTKKLNKANRIISIVSYDFSKKSDLSNGDTITVTVKPSSSKSPIKKESKKIKVTGLEEVEVISLETLLKENPVEFSGLNGYGKISVPPYSDFSKIFTVPTNTNYTNGEMLQLEISPTYLHNLREMGKKVEPQKIEVEVIGLKEISDISNINEALTKNDTYVKSRYQNSSWETYTIEKQKDYSYYDSNSYFDSDRFYLITVYKVTMKTDSKTTTKYNYYGYHYSLNADNSLDMDSAEKVAGYENTDYENLLAEIETNNFKEYKAN